jgi:heme-degrading monooxygenase HmoA
MPALQEIDGCMGVSLLVDRDSGRCIATSSWESEEAMRASADRVKQVRDRAAQTFGGNIEKIEEWEIAVLHRDHRSHEGACVRATWIKGDPAQAERNIEIYKTSVLPALENLDGFCSASLLVDRSSGGAVGSTTFDSREALERSRDQAKSIRDERSREMGVDIVDVREFELAIAHLRVPELA